MGTEITAYDIYLFTRLLMFKLHPESVVKAIDDKSYDALQEIVDGKFVVAGDPGKMVALAAESRRQALLEELKSKQGAVIDKHRRIAQMILDEMSSR